MKHLAMKRSRLAAVVFCLLLPALLPLAASALPQADLGQPIDMSLRDAELPAVLEAFARIAGGELDLPPEIHGTMTVELGSVPWKQALRQVCVMQRLSCYWSEFGSPRLVVRRSDGFSGMAESIDVSLRGAPLNVVLQSMSSVAGPDFLINVDPKLTGIIDVEIGSTPWPEALETVCRAAHCRLTWRRNSVQVVPVDDTDTVSVDAVPSIAGQLLIDHPEFETRIVERLDEAAGRPLPIRELDDLCAELGCRWTERWGDPPALEFRSADPSDGVPPPALDPSFGAEPVVLHVSLTPRGGVTTSRDLRFDWGTPSHSFGPTTDDSSTRLRLAWMPFAAQRQVLLAFAVDCSETAKKRFTVWPPIALPITKSWTQYLNGFGVSIAPGPAAMPTGKSAESSACSDPPAAFQVVLQDPTLPPAPAMPSVPMEPGNYLMVTPRPAAGGKPTPAAAVVYLGTQGDGSRALAVVRPGEDGAAPTSERFTLGPGGSWELMLGAADAPVELRVNAE